MIWPSLSQSHHCSDTTLSVVALCNNEIESPHLLAVGSDLGTVDIVDLENRTSIASFSDLHDTQVLDVEFYSRDQILSYDKFKLIHLDIEMNNRTVLYDQEDAVKCLTLSTYSSKLGSNNFNTRVSPIIASTKDTILNFDLHAPNPTVLMQNQNGITELCLLPDEFTLIGLQNNFLVATDIRMPNTFCSLNADVKFERLSCNNNYLVGVTKDCQLYSFDLPFMPTSYKSLMPYENPFISRPAFCGDYIVVGDESGMIFIIDPMTEEMEMIQCTIETPIVSVAANSSEISVALEDDIFVFSQFPFEDNLLRPVDDNEDEFIFDENGNIITRSNMNDNNANDDADNDSKVGWLKQVDDVVLEDGECSYERYGYCEQQIFVCLTCSRDLDKPIGVCEQCSIICHDGHDVRPIGTRRRFRCDCGNNRCPQFCKTMVEPKVSENTFNRYNHNFHMRWCSCDGPDVPPMVQCACCDDWFHHECIGFFSEKRCLVLDETPCLVNWVFVCTDCVLNRLTYLQEFPDADPPEEIQDFVLELQNDSGIVPFTERPNHKSKNSSQNENTNTNNTNVNNGNQNINQNTNNTNENINTNNTNENINTNNTNENINTNNTNENINTNNMNENNGNQNMNNLNENVNTNNLNDNNNNANAPQKESLDEFKKRLKRDGLGFSILGGKWIPKDLFFHFSGEPEFDEEFDKIDPTEEDKKLPISFRQKEIASFMRKTYEDIFKLVSTEGRTVIQKSDADTILGKNASQLLMERRREHDHDDDDNYDGGSFV